MAATPMHISTVLRTEFTVAPLSRPTENRIDACFVSLAFGQAVAELRPCRIRLCSLIGGGSMDAKVLLMFALLAPVLMLAAGIFAGRKSDKPGLQPTYDRPPS